jgi:predicted anti-sigma-YlaC factor YlaD
MINEHIAECTNCREHLCENEKINEEVQMFIDKLEIEGLEESQHFSYEQLQAYVNGELNEIDRMVVDSHLHVCSTCAREVEDLLTFTQELQSLPPTGKPAADSRQRLSVWHGWLLSKSPGCR